MFQMIKRAKISKKESALIRLSAIVLAFVFSVYIFQCLTELLDHFID